MQDHYEMRRRDRELTRDEALTILSRAEVATVSVVTADGPYGFPVSPVVVDGTLYFHSATKGRKVAALASDPRVWIGAFTDVVAASSVSSPEEPSDRMATVFVASSGTTSPLAARLTSTSGGAITS